MTHNIDTGWAPGQPISFPAVNTVAVDPAALPVKEVYKLLIGGIVPRPIAFVSTVDSRGNVNLAPFSFFNGVASNPPTLMVSFSRKPDGSKKDSLLNIEETGEFVVNGASEYIAAPLTHAAASFPYGTSELEKVGLSAVASERVKPPRLKESFIQFECKLYKEVEVGDGSAGSSTLVLGTIVLVHVAENAYSKGRVDVNVLRPLARLGGTTYSTIGDVVSIPIPEI